MILRKSICSKLGGTMIFETQSNLKFFIKFATQLMTNKFKFFVKILIKNGSSIEGESDFKFLYHQNKIFVHRKQWMKCDCYVSVYEFFMSFSLNSKSFRNSSFLTHNMLPQGLRGSNVSSHNQLFLNLTTFFSQNLWTYLNHLRSQISTGLKFLIGGENVI